MSNRRWLFQWRSLPPAVFAAACAHGQVALAQNAANGQVLYQQRINFPVSGALNCEDCHGPAYLFRTAASATAISGAIAADRGGGSTSVVDGMGLYGFLTAQQVADIAAYVAVALPPPPPPVSPPPAGTTVPTAPMASPNPAMLPNTVVGGTSNVINVQFTNTAATNVTFNTPAIGAVAGDAADFLVAAPTTGSAQCIAGRVMAPGTSCWFGVQFRPTAVGTRSATWSIQFTGSVAPRTLALEAAAAATSSPAPAPASAPAPAPASSANAPTSGGGGAAGWMELLGLAALGGLVGRRRREAR